MSENDNDLRRFFREAAEEVRPQGTLDDIRARTGKVDTVGRGWFLPAIAAAVVLGFVLGGAFWLNRDTGRRTAGPSGSLTDQTASGVPRERVSVAVFYAGDTTAGPRLFTEDHQLTICIDMTCRLVAGLKEALSGQPVDPDYRTLWPQGAAVDTTTSKVDESTITIGLSGSLAERPAGMSAAVANVAVQQLLRTAQAAADPTVRAVAFVLDGKVTDHLLGVPTPTRTITDGAAARDLDIEAPVQIASPYNGEKVKPGDLFVAGEAAAFEGTVQWELLIGGDAVGQSGVATARECCTLSPYDFTIKNLEPGTYTLVVHDTDESGAGHAVNQDTKEIVVE